MVKPKRKSATRDRDTEQIILDAAHSVFVRHGTAGARMHDIAEEAGVNKALLHYYFRSKNRLAEAVFTRVAGALFARVAAVLSADIELEAKVEQVIVLYLDQLQRTPYAPAYVINELNQHPERSHQLMDAVRQLREESIGPDLLTNLGAQIERRARAGAIRPIPPAQFLVNLVSLCIFPFVARPLLCTILQFDDRGFKKFIDQRKATLPVFFLNALRP